MEEFSKEELLNIHRALLAYDADLCCFYNSALNEDDLEEALKYSLEIKEFRKLIEKVEAAINGKVQ